MESTFTIKSPIDGSVLFERQYMDWPELAEVTFAARRAFPDWSTLSLEDRAIFVRKMIAYLEDNTETVAKDVSRSIGRPLHQADEIPRLRAVTEQLIEDAKATFTTVNYPDYDGISRFTKRQGKGVVLSVCAWNYPVAMPANLIIAPLLAGNTLIFKHAPQTALIGDWFAKAGTAAGLPEGVFQVVTATHPDIERLIGEGQVDVIEFIGSTRGGFALRSAAASQPVELGLEMGGNDPSYVRQDADLDLAAREIVSGAFGNSGQSCCSVERVYIHESVYDDFLKLLTKQASTLKLGHPADSSSNLGPVISGDAANRINGVVEATIASGAKSLLETQNPPDVGDQSAYVSPRILADVTHNMPIIGEEIFGPVLCAIKVSDDREAVQLMNDSKYGLTASIWTTDHALALELGQNIRCGTFYVNKCDYADLHLPWGGVGLSGMGRINGGPIGYEKLTELKSIVVNSSEEAPH